MQDPCQLCVFAPLPSLLTNVAQVSTLSVLRLASHWTPDGPLYQPLELAAALVYIGKHEALKLGISTLNLDRPRHPSGQLISIAQKLVPSPSFLQTQTLGMEGGTHTTGL